MTDAHTTPPNDRFVPILDKGFVELVDYACSDLHVVNAARASFNTSKSEMDDKDRGLVSFLMKNRHASPFEHGFLHFRLKMPLFVIQEHNRHRIASVNQESGRYSKIHPEWYVPSNYRTQVGKPGAYHFEEITDPALIDEAQAEFEAAGREAFARYERLLASGVAKEQASRVLPQTTYATLVWSVNPRAMMNYLALRNSPHAQWEIRQYAIAMEEMFAKLMPVTWEAFVRSTRVAP